MEMRLFYAVLALSLGLPTLACAQESSLRPPISGIAQVSVYASNMTESRHFYGDLLGFPETGTGSQHYRVNAQQMIQVDPLPHGETDDLESLVLATPDAEALRSYLRAKGVAVPDNVERRGVARGCSG